MKIFNSIWSYLKSHKLLKYFYAPTIRFPLISCTLQIMSLVIIVLCIMTSTPVGWFLFCLLTIFDNYLICLLAYLFRKLKVHYFLFAFALIINISEIFIILFYHSIISVQVVQLVLETNVKESSEFMNAALSSNAAWQTLICTVLIIATSWFLVKFVRKHVLSKSIAYVLMLLTLWSGVRQMSTYLKLARCFSIGSVSECLRNDNLPHLSTPYVRLLYGIAFNMASSKELKILEETVKRTQVESCSYKCPLIVLVIGESFNKHHSTLYEPEYLNTTPRLSKLQQQGNLTVFSDAVSPFNLTSNVFKYIFSTWDEECSDGWTNHTLFPAVFIKAGYKVRFITNQFVNDSDDFWNYTGGTIFNSSTLSELQFTTRNNKTVKYDEELISQFPPIQQMTSEPTLLIVHLLGQHVEYKDRYPAQYSAFSPSDSKSIFGGENGKRISAEYDNATYYNDIVVDSIFQQFRNHDAIGIYLSDHGEEAYDWRDSYDRTNEATIPQEVARYQYEIPMFVYMSDVFKQKHSDVAERIETAKNRRFISTDLCNSLFYLAGIKTKEYRKHHDVLSPSYDVNRKRIIRYDTDYDILMGKK